MEVEIIDCKTGERSVEIINVDENASELLVDERIMNWRQNLKDTVLEHGVSTIYEPDFKNKKKVEKAILNYLNNTLSFEKINGIHIHGTLMGSNRYIKDNKRFVFCELKYHIEGDWKHAHVALINYLATQGFEFLVSIEKSSPNDWYKADHYFNLTLEVKDYESF